MGTILIPEFLSSTNSLNNTHLDLFIVVHMVGFALPALCLLNIMYQNLMNKPLNKSTKISEVMKGGKRKKSGHFKKDSHKKAATEDNGLLKRFENPKHCNSNLIQRRLKVCIELDNTFIYN